MINGALFGAVLWQLIPHAIVLGWLAAMTAVLLLRFWLRHTYFRSPSAANAARWGAAFAVVVALNGLVWGAASIWLFARDSLSAQMLLMLVICGMSAGATAITSSYLPAYYAFAIPALTPLVVRLFSQPGPLLDVSSMADGKLRMESRPIAFAQLVRRVVQGMQEDLGPHHALTLELDEPPVGTWDPRWVEGIVTNLLSNASKHGADKPIRIALQRDGDAARLIVEDRGIGIPPPDLDRIFGKYERAHSARSYGGFGLGLFVVRQLAEAMGGSVAVESRPGEGARFSVWLPIAAVAGGRALEKHLL